MPVTETLLSLIRNPETPIEVIRDCVIEEGPMAKCFVVQGCTGEYSDRSEWSAAVLLSREQADAYCERLNQWCRDNRVHGSQENAGLADSASRVAMKCPLDVSFTADYTGTEYVVVEVPLVAE